MLLPQWLGGGSGIAPYTLSFGPETFELKTEQKLSGCEPTFNEVLFEKLPHYVNTHDVRHVLVELGKPLGTVAPFWCVEKTKNKDEANVEAMYISATVSTGLSLQIPPATQDMKSLIQLRQALQSDVDYIVKVPVFFNTQPLQRGDMLKIYAPESSACAASASTLPRIAVQTASAAGVQTGAVQTASAARVQAGAVQTASGSGVKGGKDNKTKAADNTPPAKKQTK